MHHRYLPYLLLGLLLPLPPAAACLWDTDTLAQEARAFPELARVITGRFPRNPPLYYEMRLERATAQIAADPDDLAAYDDAGVACDRLGDGDAAIAWMEKKRDRLLRRNEADPDAREHWYRYHANVGTFWAHRWIRDGADRERLDALKTGRDHIARAIAINPDAHFGREKYQLKAMEWLIAGEPDQPLHEYLINPEGRPVEELARPAECAEAIHGLAGLIVLGNAWESVDIFAALRYLLSVNRDASLSHLAALRCRELIEAGGRSLRPGAPTGDALIRMLALEPISLYGRWVNEADGDGTSPRPDAPTADEQVEWLSLVPLYDWQLDEIGTRYRTLRAEAEAWQEARANYLLAELSAGRHPDTHSDFWDGYTDTPPPPLGTWWSERWRRPETQLLVLALFPTAGIGLLIGYGLRLRRRRAQAE